MNRLIRFYNEKIRLPNMSDQVCVYKEKNKEYEQCKLAIFPSIYEMLVHPLNLLINKETQRLSQLRKKEYELKDRLGVN